MKTKAFAALAAVGIAATIASLAISPAIAASDPPRSLAAGSSLFGVSCETENTLQLLAIDATTAVATPIGDGANDNDDSCALQSAWDAANSTAYVSNYAYGAEDESLYSVNTTTGALTHIGAFNGDSVYADAIAISPAGAAYALYDGALYSLDLTTAKLTRIADFDEGNYVYGFAVDPTSGIFYTIDEAGVISTVNVTTGERTEVGQADLGERTRPFSLQIDTNGTLWIENDGEYADLWSVDPADLANSAVFSGTVTVNDEEYYTESLLLIPGVAITSGAPAASIVAGTPVSFTVTATGAGPITFAISSGALPTGLVLDPATGVISGTPTTPGTFTYTVTASNSAGSSSAIYTQAITAHLPVVSG